MCNIQQTQCGQFRKSAVGWIIKSVKIWNYLSKPDKFPLTLKEIWNAIYHKNRSKETRKNSDLIISPKILVFFFFPFRYFIQPQ